VAGAARPGGELDGLRAMGHTIPPCSHSGIGSVQGVVIDLRTGKQYGGADPRREGTVIPIKLRGHGGGP
jgi:gamma-glutamyltranspeptidase/glutathione hydrolase